MVLSCWACPAWQLRRMPSRTETDTPIRRSAPPATGRSRRIMRAPEWRRSFFRPATANTIEDYAKTPEYYHALSDSHYAMTIRNGQYFQRRWQLDAAGKEINVEELTDRLCDGLGKPRPLLSAPHRARHADRTCRSAGIPITAGNGAWCPGPTRNIRRPAGSSLTSACSATTAIPNIPAANQAPGSDPVFLGELPEGIDCQRCHGPGAEHVRTAGRAAS